MRKASPKTNSKPEDGSTTVMYIDEPFPRVVLRVAVRGEDDIEGQNYHLIGNEVPLRVAQIDQQRGALVRLEITHQVVVSNCLRGVIIGFPNDPIASRAAIMPAVDPTGTIVSIVEPAEYSSDETHLEVWLCPGNHMQITLAVHTGSDGKTKIASKHARLDLMGIGYPEPIPASTSGPKIRRSPPVLFAHFGILVIDRP